MGEPFACDLIRCFGGGMKGFDQLELIIAAFELIDFIYAERYATKLFYE